MDEKRIQDFADMVNATEKLCRPWRRAFYMSNLLWAAVLIFVLFHAA